jgi:enoyl-CoA hydratase/carnithine racemase
MQFEKMTLEKENGVATLTINHPEKLNAMTTKMYMDLERIIGQAIHGKAENGGSGK